MHPADLRILAALLAPVALMIAGTRRRFVRRFEQVKAFDPGHTIPLPGVRLAGLWRARLTSAGVLRESAAGRFWIDLAAWRDYRASRRRRALTVVAVMLVLLALAWAFGWFEPRVAAP
jgi:hypothetical protein